MNFVHYEDITPNFNDENWKDKCPQPDTIVHLALNTEIGVSLFEGGFYPEAFHSTVLLVARINEGGTFTTYWADHGEALEGLIVRFHTNEIPDFVAQGHHTHRQPYYVATWGRKVYDLEFAAQCFRYLVDDYGLEAIV